MLPGTGNIGPIIAHPREQQLYFKIAARNPCSAATRRLAPCVQKCAQHDAMTFEETTPRVWALHDGKSGMANQVLGLAEALGWPFDEKRLVVRAPWRHVTPHLWLYPLHALDPEGAVLKPPWPDL